MIWRKILNTYGLKWNPFTPDIPVEAIWTDDRINRFTHRVEQLCREGGFALLTGDPGTGKSVVLRFIEHRLRGLRDIVLCPLTRPQSRIADFYRELGEAFGAPVGPTNRWGGFKLLREKWRTKLEATTCRPVLIIDEAQEVPPAVLSELRILAADQFDSNSLLTVLLCGDQRLTDAFRTDELIPLGSRIRSRLVLESRSAEEIGACLVHAMTKAGNPSLMTSGLVGAIAEHSMGNWRAAMSMASELLQTALSEDRQQLDEQLFHDTFGEKSMARKRRSAKT